MTQTAGTSRVVRETLTATDFGWWLGYYWTRGQYGHGDYEEVLQFQLIVGVTTTTFAVRLYNVSGTQKFRLWNKTGDTQVGSDSSAITVGQSMLVNLRSDVAGNLLDLFVDGSNVLSASQSIAAQVASMSGGAASTGTDRYWSAWCLYVSGSDDLNETHYPEMRLIHPDGDGHYTDYTVGTYASWDDLASEGDPDDDTTYLNGTDGFKNETSTLGTHTMSNTIQAIAALFVLRQDQATKSVVHGLIIRDTIAPADKVVSFGSEDIGEDYVVREAIIHTEPGGGSWSQGIIDGLDAGHRREPGTAALNIRVTALGVVVVALGTTNLAPADPPPSLAPTLRGRPLRHLLVR